MVNATLSRYFSFAAMEVPNNDFFLGNDSPIAHRPSLTAHRSPLTA